MVKKNQANISVVIIDDETKSIEIIESLVSTYCPDIQVVGTANNINEGAKEIIMNQPEIVFLDIEMPGGNGFELLEMLKTRNFDVVFITAHNKYAISAIKHSALDYLLKPIEVKEFLETIERIKSNSKTRTVNYDILLENLMGKLLKS